MSELFNKKKKYLVIEGSTDVSLVKEGIPTLTKHTKDVIMYAGALEIEYGVAMLSEAFILADIPNAELHIYGSGSYEKELNKTTVEHPNIKYFGIVDNSIIMNELCRATLLVNPRLSKYEFTKFSFPSKNLEYMSSGTPLLTTKLGGIPEEYNNFTLLFEDESISGMAKKLGDTLTMGRTELTRIGLRAREFVLSEKNNIIQARKIIRFIQDITKE
jgi:glycosyltransferase involved in cell wall biosynthesis